MNRKTTWIAVLPSLIIPTCVGLMMYLGMSAMLEREIINNETVTRYLTGHPVSKVTLILFFIGAGSLLLIAFNLFSQFSAASSIRLNPLVDQDSEDLAVLDESDAASSGLPIRWVKEQAADVNRSVELGHQLFEMRKSYQDHYLWRRLHEALHFVHRTGSSYGLEEETKYLSELDIDRQQQRYSLVRIMIWATPMLGFLGTVLGISQALGGINVGPENDFSQMMNGLRGSLYVAFDTTALALVLSMILMFAQFVIDRFETQLLAHVDLRSRQELAANFDMALVGHEAIERMGVSVLETTDKLVDRQTKLWRQSIIAAEQAWCESATDVNDTLQENLTCALDESFKKLSRSLDTTIEKADSSMAHRWQQWQITLSESARNAKEQQNELATQTRLIHDVVDCVSSSQSNSSLSPSSESVAETEHETLVEPVKEFVTESVQTEAAQINYSPIVVEREPVPDALMQNHSETPPLKIYSPSEVVISRSDDSSGEIDHSVDRTESESPPRYRSAERDAGVESVVVFPVQVESKNAA